MVSNPKAQTAPSRLHRQSYPAFRATHCGRGQGTTEAIDGETLNHVGKNPTRPDTPLPICHQPHAPAQMQIHANLLAICSRSRKKIRCIERRLARSQTHWTLPSFRRQRTRPGTLTATCTLKNSCRFHSVCI